MHILDDKMIVPVAAGRALKFVRGETAVAHHPLAPERMCESSLLKSHPKFLKDLVSVLCYPFYHNLFDV